MFGRMLFLWLYKVSEAAWQPPRSPTEETPERYAVLSTCFIFISLNSLQGWQHHAWGYRIPTRCVIILNNFSRPQHADRLTVTITIYSACATEFYIRYFKRRPVRLDNGDTTHGIFEGNIKVMSLALAFNTTCLFIRYVSFVDIFSIMSYSSY